MARQDGGSSRKLSGAAASQRSRGASGSSDATSNAESTPSLAYPLTYLLTPIEAHHLQRRLSKVGLATPPKQSYEPVTIPTPTPSNPNTPVSALPPRGSPFGPFTSITSEAEEVALQQDVKPSLRIALKNMVQDENLPLTSRTAARAFMVGWAVNYLLQTLLPTVMRRKSPKEAALMLLAPAHTRIGLAFAAFAASYRSISYLLTFLRLKLLSSLSSLTTRTAQPEATFRRRVLSRIVKSIRGDGVVPFLAALAASPTLLLLPNQIANSPGAATFPRKTLALDLFTKGFQIHFNLLRKGKSRAVSWIPNWFDAALLYALGNGQLLWSFLFEPSCFPESYGNVILARSSAYIAPRPSDLPASVQWPSGREIADHIALLSTPTKTSSPFPGFTSPSLSALHPSSHPTTAYSQINNVLDFSPAHPAHTQLLCALLHPTEPSCRKNLVKFWGQEWKASARFISFFFAIINLLQFKRWKKDPEGSLFRFVMSVIQGATVISGSIGTAWAFTCFFQHYFPRNFLPRSRYFLNGFLSSIFIFAVPKARRAQLGLYVTRLSMDSSWQILKKRKQVKSVWNGDVILLALGFAMLASVREANPAALSGYLRTLLTRLTGPRMSNTLSASAGLPLEKSNSQSPSQSWPTSPSQEINFKTSLTSVRSKTKSN